MWRQEDEWATMLGLEVEGAPMDGKWGEEEAPVWRLEDEWATMLGLEEQGAPMWGLEVEKAPVCATGR
jgi:hypothetical protein